MIKSEEHAAVVAKVYAYDYYVKQFNEVRARYIEHGIDMCSPYFWNDFWHELP